MFCYKCGKQIEDGALYCKYCGTKQSFISEAEAGKEASYIDVGDQTSATNVGSSQDTIDKKSNRKLLIALVCGAVAVLCVVLFVTLFRSKVPEGLSKEMYGYGKKTAKIAQAYVDGKENQNTTYQQLSDIVEKAVELDDSEKAKSKKEGKDESVKYDSMVRYSIEDITVAVEQEDTKTLVDGLKDLDFWLNPDEDDDEESSLSKEIVGDWEFNFENGWYGEFTFNADGTAEYTLYDEVGDYKSSDITDYYIDEENSCIIRVYEDGSYDDDPWINISDFSYVSFEFEIAYSGKTGHATRR